jgi:hypothetical protein
MQNQSTESPDNSQVRSSISLRPTKNPAVFNVELNLPHNTVYPGKLDFSGEGRFILKRKAKHVHRKLRAWGINASVAEQYKVRWISILCDGREYITTREFLLHFGKRLTYAHCEAQYFLPLELWGVEAVREFERNEAMRGELQSIVPAQGAS